MGMEFLEGRPRELDGGLIVRRVLPERTRRNVGPFVFLDEMGPTTFPVGQGIDVRPHPHINLATLTYLFEGEIVHRDSVGSSLSIFPGAVNWMSAGHGIVHSERSSAESRRHASRLHGLQLWVALPLEHEDSEPHFIHHDAHELPQCEPQPGVRARVVAGTYAAAVSPLRTLSPVLFVDLQLEPRAVLELPRAAPEQALYVVSGQLDIAGHTAHAGQLLVLPPEPEGTLVAHADCRIALLGGAPLDARRYMWWNFVSSRPERIERAKDDWKHRRFPTIPDDPEEFVPLPER